MDIKVLAVLVLAAGLESGGDALVRLGLKTGRIYGGFYLERRYYLCMA